MKPAFALSLLLALAPAARAADTTASVASIREAFALIKPERMVDSLKADFGRMFEESFKEGAHTGTFTAEQQKVIDDFRDQVTAVMMEELDWTKIEPVVIDAYAHTFSQREVDAMTAFYRTPEGGAILEKMPQLTVQTSLLMQQRMRDLLPRLQVMQGEMIDRLKATRTSPQAANP